MVVAAVPAPLACDAAVTFDPVSRSLLVKVSGFGASFWRRGHAAMLAAEEAGRYWAAPTVYAHAPGRRDIARGEPVRDGWLRFKLNDADYRRESLHSKTSPISFRCGLAPARRSGRATFSYALSDGSRLDAWKTKPIRARRSLVSRTGLSVPRSVSPSRTRPEEGRSKPAAHCSRVDLPDPDAPMTAVNEPRLKAYVRSRSAATLPAPER